MNLKFKGKRSLEDMNENYPLLFGYKIGRLNRYLKNYPKNV
jgi:hypothetical protein